MFEQALGLPPKWNGLREEYNIGDTPVISYELTDSYGHTIQLDPQQALDLLTWLNTLKGQITRDLYPEIAEPTKTMQTKPDASTRFRTSWIDDLEI